MYAEFFGLRELPFNNTPDPRFFYPTPDHEEALASLVYAVKERKGFVLLTGEVGAGKTLIARMMLRRLGTGIAFANINHAVSSTRDLMESLCAEFELHVDKRSGHTQLVRLLHDFLLARFSQDSPVVLVLDEAQNLPLEAFEQLRMIGNLEADDAKLLQIAIVGQPELQRMFASPQLRQLRQRIFRSFHLPALDHRATQAYIKHRLSLVGSPDLDLFSPDAIDRIYAISRGLPRLINTTCDNAMLSAYSADRRKIDGPFVDAVCEQMMMVGGASTMEAPGATTEDDSRRPAAARPITSGRAGAEGIASPDTPPPSVTAAPRVTETLDARLLRIEARISNGIDPRPVGPGLAVSAEAARELVDLTGQLESIKSQVRQELNQITRRLSLLERGSNANLSLVTEARVLRADLEPLVQRAESVVGRAESVSRTLLRREEQLQVVAGTVPGVVRELRNLLIRWEQTVPGIKHEQRQAERLCKRLSGQSQRLQRLADSVTQLVHRAVPRGLVEPSVASFHGQRVLGPADDPDSISIPGLSTTEQTERVIPETERVQQMLQVTQKSLTQLRALARRSDGRRARRVTNSPATSDPPEKPSSADLERGRSGSNPPSASRLAETVENLVTIVQADG